MRQKRRDQHPECEAYRPMLQLKTWYNLHSNRNLDSVHSPHQTHQSNLRKHKDERKRRIFHAAPDWVLALPRLMGYWL